MNAHLSQDELVERIYGVDEGDSGSRGAHLRECAECSARLDALLHTRTRLREEADAALQGSSVFFAAQRRAVYARLEAPGSSPARWVPALAAAGLLAMGLLWFPHGQAGARHAANQAVEPVANTEEQLFSDLYSKEQSIEPSGLAPLHELFDAGAGPGEP